MPANPTPPPAPAPAPAQPPAPEPRRRSRVHQKRQKACDACHRRKIKCDGTEGSGGTCSYCFKNRYECTYDHKPNKWPPAKAYVDGLEQRCAELERRVERLQRALDRALHRPRSPVDSSEDELDEEDHWAPREDGGPGARAGQDEDEHTQQALRTLTEGYEDLWLGNPAGMRVEEEPRLFHGQASHFQVVNLQMAEMGRGTLHKDKFFHLRVRPEFRLALPDVMDTVDLDHAGPEWPEPDLAWMLVDAFFERWNTAVPLLHKPTFVRQYSDPLMRKDHAWVSLAFGVFAVGAKYVDDPRACGPADAQGHHFDAGVKYWNEMRRVASPLIGPPSLLRLQALILFTDFLGGQPLFPSAGWALIGLALRYVQDAGMHVKKEWARRAKAQPFEYEMRKRVFWALYMMERTMALEMDRSFCMPEEDYDVDPLLELDDPALDLLQQGKENPSGFSLTINAWNTRMRLLQFASRKRDELYTLRHLAGSPDLHEREEKYLRSIPVRLESLQNGMHPDLVYKPDLDEPCFTTVASLYIQFRWVQLTLTRPFFPKYKRVSHPRIPLLAMSTSAAYDIIGVLDRLRVKGLLRGRVCEGSLAGFVSGTVLLMSMWEHKTSAGMEQVEMCCAALQALEDRWQFPGLLHDVLKSFAHVMERVLSGDCPHAEWQPTTMGVLTSCPCGQEACEHVAHMTHSLIETGSSTAATVATSNSAVASPTSVDYNRYSILFPGADQDPFTNPFSAGQTRSFFSAEEAPLPASQPMFGENGWVNDLNMDGSFFMDPQFNEWLGSMLVAAEESFPIDSAAAISDSDSAWLASMALNPSGQPPS
ncbi:hypothetical protein CALCODRAFT_517897 [Calocera cornea HHB12733]|uniref:Zn(2)-C6 fungal-type domain-containing protein n=1 Tax=Calocera cornea HHB12733 TaxID=1353952 RepID=A0A165FIC1_9BASI|nr:hypothetical protein CALCODRAFT_517897 [Calocera cornea HHB12733]